ncbi:MAG: Large exoproteins involved in heme utilization or adhesion [uncultured Microvirga sp.]|uniref:Large exoproteins involved in heme utilization or adhesion n=1 Tax=uncultured Microvirga sp. TaxID=412392 RepID=A0A6J4KPC7_9HYPH|nr:MAG: Large exoproteins involved in heme utilization or adhesion [uncultured Microvirga sp.]
MLRGALYVALGLALAFILPVGLAYLRLSMGPFSFDGLADRAAEAIKARVGDDWRVDVAGSAIELKDGWLALRATGLDIRNPEGVLVVRAPDAIVSVDTASLLRGAFVAKAIEFRDLQLDASIDRSGALSFVPTGEAVAPSREAVEAGTNPGAPASAPGPHGLPPADSFPPLHKQPSPVSKSVASLFDLVLEPSGLIGALDRAKLTNARLRILDENRRERAAFRHVAATFERNAPDRRRFDLHLDGSAGGWRLQGDLRLDGDGRREGTVTATDVPIQDLLLFAGMSGLPVATDARLTGRLDVAIDGGRLTRLETRLGAGRGIIQIDDRDMPPIGLEAASAEGSWNEEQHAFALKHLTYRNGDTLIQLAGTLKAVPNEPWRIDLRGENAVLGVLEPGDPAVAVDSIEASLAAHRGGVVLERLAVHGPTVNATMSASYGNPADAKALEVNIFAEATKARSFLRLWPNLAVPKIRGYLAANLRAGTIETLSTSVAMSGDELAGAFSDKPIPDGSVRVDFGISDGTLHVGEGLPPLTRLQIAGSVTGTRAEVSAQTGAVGLADGRALMVSNGRLSLPQIWSPNVDARIGFRLDGGADAVASLLRAPALREVTGELDFDPAQIRGQADLSVSLDLPIRNVPSLADVPVAVSGTVTGVGIEKAFGKERLENGQLSVNYTGGNLAIRGEGRLGGTPSLIDIRQPRNLPGEATVSFSLDEATRARKGIVLGTGLRGALPVRVVAPLGRGAKPGARVEVDLTRATIDNLLPGWSKPPGSAGKLSFVAQEVGGEIREITLESGPVQMRGSATLSTFPVSCRPISGRCSAAASGRSAGRRCRATRRTSTGPTRR